MLAWFKEHIRNSFPFLEEAGLLVAVSGGIDSVVLARLCHTAGLKMALVHCNFHLRGEDSNGDEDFVRALAEELGVPVFTTSFRTEEYAAARGISIQIAARELRYDWFGKVLDAEGYDYLLTAHHADDMLETFLINLSRGTGIEGLAGIPAVNGKIARPLLPFSREQLFGYLQENGWTWREDGSNADTKYLRNRIRHRVVPELKQLSQGFLEQFGRTQRHLRECEQILEGHMDAVRDRVFFRKGERWTVAVDDLKALDPKETYLYYLFREFDFPVDEIRKLLYAMSGKFIVSDKYVMLKNREELIITPQKEREKRQYEIPPGTREIFTPVHLQFLEGEATGKSSANTAMIDKDKLKYPLVLRKWEKGDYFYPLGMTNRKKVSKFFKDERFSVFDKEDTWLLCSGKDIVWIVGHRLDDRFKVAPDTGNILRVVLCDS
ncbi:tRNA lysidine(34) synthetase TilS [Sinomicrobium soli]|uniref:tRNA lysidine(34) synthetase TilS n=1 Tax=Sinomicrobium sp. N-1-3-6 TaxID=2219864 RepID=UPI0011BF57B9|nr:tRNA lysidine(34) synthetase TilS [Sinomicrobium sp. N-1-3-6]